jgi:hypothetical protein
MCHNRSYNMPAAGEASCRVTTARFSSIGVEFRVRRAVVAQTTAAKSFVWVASAPPFAAPQHPVRGADCRSVTFDLRPPNREPCKNKYSLWKSPCAQLVRSDRLLRA